jgi:phage gp46-like protein
MATLGMVLDSGKAAAEGIQVKSAELKLNNEAYELNADTAVSLNKNLEDALKKGLILHFQTEFELSRPRSWWFDESVAEATRTSILSYHLLLRRYYLETNYQLKTYDTLSEALTALGHIDGWPVVEKKLLRPRQTYKGRLRLRLDLGQLPKPLQINALTGAKWGAEGEWYEWKFEP